MDKQTLITLGVIGMWLATVGFFAAVAGWAWSWRERRPQDWEEQ